MKSQPSRLGYLLVLIGVLFGGKNAQAFPEFIREGYNNCTTCHYNPQGGGLVTPYGRSLSKEIMSTWSYDREEEWFHGALPEGAQDKVEEWLHVGADIRAIQIHMEDSTQKRGEFFLMQETYRVGLGQGKLMAFADIGRLDDPEVGNGKYYGYGTAYYLLYQPTDSLYVKGGRFFPAFGINLPEHNLVTKVGTGLQPGVERDGLDVSWITKTWCATVEALVSPPAVSPNAHENVYTAQLLRVVNDRFKIGASLWSSEQEGIGRLNMQAVHGVLGFTPHFYALAEVDRREDTTSALSQRGLYHMQRWGYEFVQGVHGLAMYQFSQSDMKNGGTRQDRIGPGVQLFPRPHFDIMAFWNRVLSANNNQWSDEAYALFHYYF